MEGIIHVLKWPALPEITLKKSASPLLTPCSSQVMDSLFNRSCLRLRECHPHPDYGRNPCGVTSNDAGLGGSSAWKHGPRGGAIHWDIAGSTELLGTSQATLGLGPTVISQQLLSIGPSACSIIYVAKQKCYRETGANMEAIQTCTQEQWVFSKKRKLRGSNIDTYQFTGSWFIPQCLEP